MNVIKNILTTKHYRQIKTALEIKRALTELQDIDLDFNDKNIALTYKRMIEDKLLELVKDLPSTISVTTDSRWDQISNTGVLTRDSSHIRSDEWHFNIDVANGPGRGITRVMNANDLRQIYGLQESSSNVAFPSGTVNLDNIVAEFNGNEIGTLEAVTYTSSRSNTKQN